jgi:hypothetical protein
MNVITGEVAFTAQNIVNTGRRFDPLDPTRKKGKAYQARDISPNAGKSEERVISEYLDQASRRADGFDAAFEEEHDKGQQARERQELDDALRRARKKDIMGAKFQKKESLMVPPKGTFEAEARRFMMEPAEPGVLNQIDRSEKRMPVPGGGIDPERQMAQAVREEIKTFTNIETGEQSARNGELKMDLPQGVFFVEKGDFVPTMRAYCESRGMPLDRLTTMDDLQESKRYVADKLKKTYSDDPEYINLTSQIEETAKQMDQAWKNREPIEEFLTKIDSLQLLRNKTTRALYMGISEGIDLRESMVRERNKRLSTYEEGVRDELASVVSRMENLSQEDFIKGLRELLYKQYSIEPGDEKLDSVVETIAGMKKIGRECGILEFTKAAAYYYLSFEKAALFEDSGIITPLFVGDGSRADSEQTIADYSHLGKAGILHLGKPFFALSLQKRMLVLVEELGHKIDGDVLKPPTFMTGEEIFAYGISTEVTAQFYRHQLYERLKKETGFTDREEEQLAVIIKQGGPNAFLQYGVRYMHRALDRLNN